MSKTEGEKREYSRGYSRATYRFICRAREIAEIARGYRARLADHDTARQCHTCQRWKRGGDKFLWGVCAGNFEQPQEPSMWADSFAGETWQRKIITTEDFGCVNWLPIRPPVEP